MMRARRDHEAKKFKEVVVFSVCCFLIIWSTFWRKFALRSHTAPDDISHFYHIKSMGIVWWMKRGHNIPFWSLFVGFVVKIIVFVIFCDCIWVMCVCIDGVALSLEKWRMEMRIGGKWGVMNFFGPKILGKKGWRQKTRDPFLFTQAINILLLPNNSSKKTS